MKSQHTMTMDKLGSLPIKINPLILSHVPLKSPLAYSETSRKNHEQHVISLRRLRNSSIPKMHLFK